MSLESGRAGLIGRLAGPMALACLLVLAANATRAAAQQADDAFTIHDVPVDASASSASQAREIAIAKGEQDALHRLFDSMVLKQDQDFLPSPDASQLSALIDGISVTDEKVSSTRYLAKLTVYFKADDVRTLLQRAGIAFSETVSKPVLILPVLETAGYSTLWTNPNPWLDAWKSFDQTDSHVPFILPDGGTKEAASLSAVDVITGNPDTIKKLASDYGVSDVYLAYAKLQLDPDTGEYGMRVLFLKFGDDPAVMGDDMSQPPTDAAPMDRVPAMMTAAVATTVSEMKEAWKRQTLVNYGAEVSLPVTVPVSTLSDWIMVQKQLEDTPIVRAIDVRSMTVHEAHIAIKYLGNPKKLALALAQSDLKLTQNPAGDWVMTSSDAITSQ